MATSDELSAAHLEWLSRVEAPDLAEAGLALLEQVLSSLVRLRAAHPGVELGGF
jgi:hypothetical protein